MIEEKIIKYYNKFPEDKRLKSRHGQVEMAVTCKMIEDELCKMSNPKILDIGAGTGAYSFYFAEKGYDVIAVELVKFNLGVLKSKGNNVKAYQGDARDLKRFKDNSFDVVLLFGPMYHLVKEEDKLLALKEAARVAKRGGVIFVAYLMADYAIITHAFKDGFIKDSIKDGKIDENFNLVPSVEDLYSYVKVTDIIDYANKTGLKRLIMFAPDGAADYMRQSLNSMDEETFRLFIKYQMSVATREDLIGASSHIVDVLTK